MLMTWIFGYVSKSLCGSMCLSLWRAKCWKAGLHMTLSGTNGCIMVAGDTTFSPSAGA